MDHRWLFFNYFFKLDLSCKSICSRFLLTFFFSNILFFNEWRIGLNWRSNGFHDIEFNKEINLVSIKMHLCYLAYFRGRNSLLGRHSSHWKQQQILGFTVSKLSMMSVILLSLLKCINLLLYCHVEKSRRWLYSRTESAFRKLEINFSHN